MSEFLFENLNLSDEIMRAIEKVEYKNATEIQAKAIPLLLEGKDIVGKSNTGTGKTAAFGIPAVENVDNTIKKPQVLILSPTRELAMQICDEMRKFSMYKHGVKMAAVYGGAPIEKQIRDLKGANIVVGTPGRMMDHMRRKTLKLDDIKTVILDEADEMLNMGFIDDIKTILSEVPEERQTVLFSATMPEAIMEITREFQKDPITVAVNNGQRTLDAIEQIYYQVPMGRKKDVVNLILQMYTPKRSVVFCNTKKMVDELVEYLNDHSFKAMGLHGDMKQSARTSVMDSYKKGKTKVLVATDVAARGIDVSDVEVVINYDIPQDNEYYIHRIGRTGRAGREGKAFTLLTNRRHLNWIRDIAKFTNSQVREEEIPNAEDLHKKYLENLKEKIVKSVNEENITNWEFLVDEIVNENNIDYKSLCSSLISLVAKKNKRVIPIVISSNKKEKNEVNLKGVGVNGRVRLSVNIGRNERIAPNFIVGAIVEESDVPAKAIGKIDIYHDHTIVELSTEAAKTVLECMSKTKIKNKKVSFKLAEKKHKENVFEKMKSDKKMKSKINNKKNSKKKSKKKR